MKASLSRFLLVLMTGSLLGCANISTPSGGKRDATPPRLIKVNPGDSLLNARVSRVELTFDEYITLADAQKEVQISPMLPIPLVVSGVNKRVVVKLTDSLLEDNTTYRISFGKAIRDLHEGNPFSGYTYTFSTSGYFDSCRLQGQVVNAATGAPDTANVFILLYSNKEDDSAIIKKKPKYITKPDNGGIFRFVGLPSRNFRIYAVKDANNNLIYDGGTEMIAFCDTLVKPQDSATGIVLRLFAEQADTTLKADTLKASKKPTVAKGKMNRQLMDSNLVFTTNLDTSNKAKRTFNLTDSIKLVFNRPPEINSSKVALYFDSADVVVHRQVRIRNHPSKPEVVYVVANLSENTVYTLDLQEGFATDTGKKRAASGKYVFRTFNNDDFGKIKLNIPAKYGSRSDSAVTGRTDHLLMLLADADTIYCQKITDTVVHFRRLPPANYTFRIIVDKNGNGGWDTGDLLAKRQPEYVIPGSTQLTLKAGWDHNIDFESKPKPTMKKSGSSDKTPSKK